MKKVNVLLVDDHAVVRSGIVNALKELPNLDIVGEASNGPELFLALARAQPDFLIVDVAMPDFEPISAIRQIRSNYPDLKILVVSAYDDDVYVQGLLKAGVDGYHLKDQSLTELQLAVKRILSGKKWISSPLLEKLVSHTDAPPPVFNIPVLTSRQQEILQLLQQGLDNQGIAQRIELNIKTVEKHLTRLYRKLEVQSRLEAVNYVTKHPEILATSKQSVTQPVPLSDTAMLTPISVLLVDDNVRYRQKLQRMLVKVYPPAIINEAKNTEEAVILLQHIPPRLALIDVVLGNENGIDCARRLKALSPQLRVVMITAYPDPEFHKQALKAGALALLDKKDLVSDTLRQIIDDTLESYEI